MHPADCPPWDYERHPKRKQLLEPRAEKILQALYDKKLDSEALSADPRPVHGLLFRDLTPKGYEYYAGHFRGEFFRCLRYCSVGIPSDPSVGCHPANVRDVIREFAREVRTGIRALDQANRIPRAVLSDEDKLIYVVTVACRVFELFLRIHPFVNGNGHMGRFILLAVLTRYGHLPKRWTIEPRPADPPYTNLIKSYRFGPKEPLEQFILKAIRGN